MPTISDTLFVDAEQQAPHRSYGLETSYERDEGLLQVPVAAPPSSGGVPCEIVRTHAPLERKVVHWSGTRDVINPLIPEPTPQNSNFVLMGRSLVTEPAMLLPNGLRHSVSLSGAYVYAGIVPHAPALTVSMGRMPFDETASGTFSISSADYQPDIMPPD